MCFKLSKKQLIILLVVALIGGVLSYFYPATSVCKEGICNEFLISDFIYGFLIVGIITYIIEIINNYFKK